MDEDESGEAIVVAGTGPGAAAQAIEDIQHNTTNDAPVGRTCVMSLSLDFVIATL